MKRYQKPTGAAAVAAARVPRGPTDGPDAFPGAGKGLNTAMKVET